MARDPALQWTVVVAVLLGLFLGLPGRASRRSCRRRADHWRSRSRAGRFSTHCYCLLATTASACSSRSLSRRRWPISSPDVDSAVASILEAIVDLPIVLPPSVAGLALLLVFGRRGAARRASWRRSGSRSRSRRSPWSSPRCSCRRRSSSARREPGSRASTREIEDAARVDGAGERQVPASITIPLAAPALAAGLVMTWARALGEFGATIMFAGNVAGRTQTLPLVVYGEFQSGDLDASVAAAAILVLAAFAVLSPSVGLRWGRALDLRGA